MEEERALQLLEEGEATRTSTHRRLQGGGGFGSYAND